MKQQSFTKFKEDFYSRVPDLALFDCGEINLFKVVLDGLKVGYVQRSKAAIPNYIFSPLRTLIFFLKRKRALRSNRNLKANYLKVKEKFTAFQGELLIIDDINTKLNPQGNRVSFYFENVTSFLRKKGIRHLFFSSTRVVQPGVTYDIDISAIAEYAKTLPLNQEQKKLTAEVKKTLQKIEHAGIFTPGELADIKAACVLFLYDFKLFNHLLEQCDAKAIFITNHYHREGMILALKKKNIEVVELQHGLISPEDIFYMLPQQVTTIRDRALFSDRIFTFGDFWANRLKKGAEFAEEQIDTFGFYPYENTELTQPFLENEYPKIKGKKVILITTQTFLEELFISYTKQLSEQLIQSGDKAIILLKTHPMEKREHYQSLWNISNVLHPEESVEALFSIADVHISIFSTTLYDALRYGVSANFSLQVPEWKDYIDSVLESGVAAPLRLDENPLDKMDANDQQEASNYYKKPNYQSLIDLVLS